MSLIFLSANSPTYIYMFVYMYIVVRINILCQILAKSISYPKNTELYYVAVFCSCTVLYSYEQCLLCFGHCADIWYEASLYLQRASEAGVSPHTVTLTPHTLALIPSHPHTPTPSQDTQHSGRWSEEAGVMYHRATSGPLRDSLLLHFAYADYEEVGVTSGCGHCPSHRFVRDLRAVKPYTVNY